MVPFFATPGSGPRLDHPFQVQQPDGGGPERGKNMKWITIEESPDDIKIRDVDKVKPSTDVGCDKSLNHRQIRGSVHTDYV